MKTIYNQTDVGRRASWLYPLFKPLLTLFLVLTLGMTVNAQERHTMWGSSFCWDSATVTSIGMDTAQPGMYHVLLHFRTDGKVEKTTMVLPSTDDGFEFVFDFGKNPNAKGFYVTYVYTEANYLALVPLLNNLSTPLPILLAAIQTGVRQTGETWIFAEPTIQTLGFYGSIGGRDYTAHGDTAIYCKDAAGVSLDTTENSNYTFFVGPGINDVISRDHWIVNYTISNGTADVFDTIPGDGDTISWTGIRAEPNIYSATGVRGLFYTGTGAGCPAIDMDGKPEVMDTLTDVKNISTGLCYLTIQEAIDDIFTNDQDTIYCLVKRDYVENVFVDKALTIMPDPLSADLGFTSIMGAVTIASPNVTIQKFDMIMTLDSNVAIGILANSGNFLIDSIGQITGATTGVKIEPLAGGGTISNSYFTLNPLGIVNNDLNTGGTGRLLILDNTIEGTSPLSTDTAINSVGNGVLISGNFFNDVAVAVCNDGGSADTIIYNSFSNVNDNGICVNNDMGHLMYVTKNDFGFINTTAINTNHWVNAVANWYGSPNGPTIASNQPCGDGSRIIETVADYVTYSPWYFAADTTFDWRFIGYTYNGNPDLTLSDIPNMTTVSGTPLVFSMSVTYPDTISNYDVRVLTDARISSTLDFPIGSEVISLKYNGFETLAAPFALPNNDTVYLSEILGATKGNPFYNHNDLTNVWKFVIGGFDHPWTSTLKVDAVTYIDSIQACNSVLAIDTARFTFDTAELTIIPIDMEVCTGVDSLRFNVSMQYPAIKNIDPAITTDALIVALPAIPSGTVILWGYNTDPLPTQSYTVSTDTNMLLLSTIMGAGPMPLLGHDGRTDILSFKVDAPVGTYRFAAVAFARYDTLNFEYDVDLDTLVVRPLPTAHLGLVDDQNHICSEDSAHFKVDLTGTAPWTITYTDRIDTTTVTDIRSTIYYFQKKHLKNKTWEIISVSDSFCSNQPTDTVRVYVGTVTYVGKPSTSPICEGEQVTIPIKVVNFEDVGVMSLTLNYDSAVLDYVDFVNPNPDLADFTLVGGDGTVKAGGYSLGLNGYALADSATLFEMLFTYKSGTTSLKWDTTNPAACEYVAASSLIPFCDVPGKNYYINLSPDLTGHLRPKAAMEDTATICRKDSTLITVVLVGTAPWTFTYSYGADTVGHQVTIPAIGDSLYKFYVHPDSTTIYYPVDVTDANGCSNWRVDLTGLSKVIVNQLPTWTDTVVKVSCFGADNGSISVTTSGVAPFSYQWNRFDTPGGGLPDSSTITGLAPGFYHLEVTDGNGCHDSATYQVLGPEKLAATVSHTDLTCIDANDGTITVKNPTGGWGKQQVSIDGTSYSNFVGDTIRTYLALVPDTLVIYLRDSLNTGCIVKIDTVIIHNQIRLGINYGMTKSDVTCNGADDGVIGFKGFHGGHGTYQASIDSALTWSDIVQDSTDVTFDSLAPGIYDLFVRDAAYVTCVRGLGSLTVTEPDTLFATIEVDSVTCFGGSDGKLTVHAHGGYKVYQYSLNGEDWFNDSVFSNKLPGVYNISIRDKAHTTCLKNIVPAVTIYQPVVMDADTASTKITCHGADDGTITFSNASGGHGGYEYSINDQANWFADRVFDSVGPGTYLLAIRDSAYHSCVITLGEITLVEPNAIPFVGTIVYYKDTVASRFPLGNVIVALVSGTDTVAKDTTLANGHYLFNHVCPGNYSLVAYSKHVPVLNPVNITDAAMITSWRTSHKMIEKVQFFAGDVLPTRNRLESNDASKIMEYFLYNFVPQWNGRDKWTYWILNDTITRNRLSGSSVLYPSVTIDPLPNIGDTLDLFGLFTGDFNASWTSPTVKSYASTLRLDVAQTLFVEPGTEFELPILAGKSMEVGAMSLLINFPSDKLEILGAYLANDENTPVLFNLIGDELRMGWTSITPLNLQAGDRMITLKLKLTEALAKDELLQLTLTGSNLNELADGDVKVLTDALLVADKIGSKPISVGEITSEHIAFANYPNPFTQTTTFVFSLPYSGVATIEVYDMLGKKVLLVVNETMTAGEHKLTINSNTLKPGVYTASLTLNTDGQKLQRTIKIIRNQ